MTLQRDMPVRLFGTSDSACHAELFLNSRALCEADIPCGEFEIILPAQPATFDAALEIKTGDERICFENVDFGEVWIAGGQSNMEFLLKYDYDYRRTKESSGDVSEDRHHRFYDVPEYAHEWQEGFNIPNDWGVWRSLNSKDAPYFSAVGKYFADVLRAQYPEVPVAIVGCNWGGTRAATWTDIKHLSETPELREQVEKYEKDIEGFSVEDNLPREKTIKEQTAKAGKISDKILLGDFSKFEKKLSLLMMKLFRRSTTALTPFSENRPSGLYSNMLMRIKGYSARGVIWYQGESDEVRAEIYDKCFAALIASWREAWSCELPFLFVQVAPFGEWFGNLGTNYPMLRARQELAASTVPSCYMASIMDWGQEDDIHPKHKKPVGERLALLALGHIYGEDIPCDPPKAVSATLSGDEITVAFENVGGGLSLDGNAINGLELFADGASVKSFDARLEQNKIYISVPTAARGKSLEVRYCYLPYCEANIHTAQGLCAMPFALTVE